MTVKNWSALVAIVAVFVGNLHTSRAESFAAGVVSYVPGTNATYLDPTVALGKPGPGVAGYPGWNNAETLNPFNAHFDASELVQIGPGGSLTLRLERFVNVGPGRELGVFGHTGLMEDFGNPNTSLNPAVSFGADEVVIEVSETGQPGEWAALNGGNRVVIGNPVSYFTDDLGHTGPTDLVADLLPELSGFTPSDFGLPLENPLGTAAYDGLTISEITALFAGSAGGDWFDLDGLLVGGQPLTKVGYVRFFDPLDPDPLFGGSDLFELMAVSINSSLAGASVPIPEPTTCVLGAGLLGVALLQRRRTPLR
jgi:hypothetical protein